MSPSFINPFFEQDPYSKDFANAFDAYMDTLVNKVLPHTSYEIIAQYSLSGYIEYTLQIKI